MLHGTEVKLRMFVNNKVSCTMDSDDSEFESTLSKIDYKPLTIIIQAHYKVLIKP